MKGGIIPMKICDPRIAETTFMDKVGEARIEIHRRHVDNIYEMLPVQDP